MSTLKTHNLQSPDASSVNIALTQNSGMVVAGISTLGIGAAGGVDLLYQNVSRLSTQSYGIAVNGNILLQEELVHVGDTDTRIKFPSAGDIISFETAGSERLRIDAYGRVLIGGTSAVIASSSEFAEIVLTGKTRGAGITLQDVDANTRFQIRTDDAGGDPQTLLNASTNHPITIRTNNTERLRIKNDGNISVIDGNIIMAPGHGIDFSATGNANGTTNSELFHDYEEGTWTPNSGTNMGTLSGTIQGNYIKIGSMCFIQFGFTTSSVHGSQSSRITGLPFTPADNNSATGVENTGCIFHDNGFYFAWVNGGANEIYIEAAEPLYGNAITGSQHIRGSLYYHVA